MTRINDLQRDKRKLKLSLNNRDKCIKKLNKKIEKMFKEFEEYINGVHSSYEVMLSLERDHMFDRYESHATAMKYREEYNVEFGGG